MILKRLPEDFKVTEIPKIKEDENGKFSVYLLKKKNIDTLGAIQIIKRRFSLKHVEVAGLKDKHSESEQYVSIPGRNGVKYNVKERNFKLEFKFYSNEPLHIGFLEGNKFEIVVRKIQASYIKILEKRSSLIERGIPNYYGEQRFGSYSSKSGFLGKALIKKEHEKALKIYLTHFIRSENKDKKELKKFVESNWKSWDDILKYLKRNKIKNSLVEKIIRHLKKSNNDFYSAVKIIPERYLRLYIEAYQSFIWNEITRRIIEKIADKKFSLSYIAGILFFYDEINEENLNLLNGASFNFKEIKAKKELRDFIEKTKKEVFMNESINEKILVRPFFNAGVLRKRKILIFPKEFSVVDVSDDELYRGFKKARLRFNLPSGSYATMVTRLLFKH